MVRDERIKLESTVNQSDIKPDDQIVDTVFEVQKEELENRKRIKLAHKQKLRVINDQLLSEESKEAAINEAIIAYDEKIDTAQSIQHVRIADAVMKQMRAEGEMADQIKSEIQSCDLAIQKIMTEVMAIKIVVESADNSQADRREMLEII